MQRLLKHKIKRLNPSKNKCLKTYYKNQCLYRVETEIIT